MYRKSIILLFLIHCAVRYTAAQDFTAVQESRHHITLSLGIASHTVRDEMMSPFLYRGTPVPTVLTYRFLGASYRHTILLSYDKTELHSSIPSSWTGGHLVKNLKMNCEYTVSARTAAFDYGFRTTLFLGGKISTLFNIRDYYIVSDHSSSSGEGMASIGLNMLAEAPLPRGSVHTLSMEIGIPFISYAILTDRYNANVSPHFNDLALDRDVQLQVIERGKFISFNKLFELQADIAYLYVLSSYIGIEFRYRLLYYSFAQYEDLFHARVLNNEFLLGLTVML